MKRIIISLFCLIISFPAFCQTQKGIVLESTITAGQQRPLQDVSLQVRGNINSVLTNARGEFIFERNSLEDKKAFTLIKVYKKGFDWYIYCGRYWSTSVYDGICAGVWSLRHMGFGVQFGFCLL